MSTAVMSSVANSIVLSFVLTVAVALILRAVANRGWNASTRYIVWFVTLAITIGLPFLLRFRAVSLSDRIVENPIPPIYQIAITTGPWMRWIIRIWIFSSSLMLVRLLFSCAVLHRRKAAAVAPSFGSDRANQWLKKCGSARRARLAISDDIAAPIAAGPTGPSILIPSHLIQKLSNEEIEQIGLHEAAHLARRDDYALVFQRVCEALFVFHPVVHWITRHMDLEREVACDDFVVEITGRPRPYAECLTRVVELAHGGRLSPLAAPATQARSVLESRLDKLLDQNRRTGTRLMKARLASLVIIALVLAWMGSAAPQLILFAPAVETATGPRAPLPTPSGSNESPERSKETLSMSSGGKQSIVTSSSPVEAAANQPGISLLDGSSAKPDADGPSNPAAIADRRSLGIERMFDIASGRTNESYPSVSVSGCREPATRYPDWCVLVRHTLPGLIATAYESFDRGGIEIPRKLIDQIIVGVPAWAGHDQFFDVEARAQDGFSVSADELHRMLQLQLADRFKLKFHRESREIASYILSVDANASRLKRPATGRPGTPISALMRSLAIALDRPILDRTGLTGRYDFTLAWPPDEDRLSNAELLEALRDQLGLRLEPQTIAVDVIVIDSAEKPDGNS